MTVYSNADAQKTLRIDHGANAGQTWYEASPTDMSSALLVDRGGTRAVYLGTPADGTAVGGNNRAANGVDFTLTHGTGATYVVADANSVGIGNNFRLTASGVGVGTSGNLGVTGAIGIGASPAATGIGTLVVGYFGGTTGITGGVAIGKQQTIGGNSSVCIGHVARTNNIDASVVIGAQPVNQASNSAIIGGLSLSTQVLDGALGGLSYLTSTAAQYETFLGGIRPYSVSYCQVIWSGNNTNAANENGDSQGLLVPGDKRTTTVVTNQVITAYSLAHMLIISSNTAITFQGLVTIWNETDNNVSAWEIEGVILNPAGAPSLVGTTITNIVDQILGGGVVTISMVAVAGATDYLSVRYTLGGAVAKTLRANCALFCSQAQT